MLGPAVFSREPEGKESTSRQTSAWHLAVIIEPCRATWCLRRENIPEIYLLDILPFSLACNGKPGKCLAAVRSCCWGIHGICMPVCAGGPAVIKQQPHCQYPTSVKEKEMSYFPVNPGWRGMADLASWEGLWSALRHAEPHVRGFGTWVTPMPFLKCWSYKRKVCLVGYPYCRDCWSPVINLGQKWEKGVRSSFWKCAFCRRGFPGIQP